MNYTILDYIIEVNKAIEDDNYQNLVELYDLESLEFINTDSEKLFSDELTDLLECVKNMERRLHL